MDMPLLARYRLCALALLCAVPYAAMLHFCAQHGSKPRSVLALLATAVLLWLLLAGCTRNWRRFFLAYFPLLIASAAYAAYALVYGIPPGHTLGILLLSASWEEVSGLLMLWPQKWLLLPLLAIFVVYLWLAWRLPQWPIFSGRAYIWARALLVLALPITAYAATSTPQLVDGIALNPVTGSLMFFAGELPRARAELSGKNVVKAPYRATRAGVAEEVHILVIGESERRASWSTYGYTRPTTPYLEGIAAETFLLKHVTADANVTFLAVPMILTGIAPEDLQTAKMHGTLVDLAKEAGYSTTWLVNQDINVSISLGITADRFDHPPEMQPGLWGRHTRDDALLPGYRRALAQNGSRFIGMHVMGSHWEYYLRYPPSFQRFGHARGLNPMSLGLPEAGQTVVDAYDNSVLYTDWFLQQVIEGARALKVPATVTFLPDHGESLEQLDDGLSGHGQTIYTPSQFEIPAFVWVNGPYRTAHPQQVAALAKNSDKRIRSHDFFYAVADLMGISWPEDQPQHSFASEKFVPETTRVVIAGGVERTLP